MTDELLPCPFCASAARLYDYDTEMDTWPIECDNPECWARVQSKDSPERAVSAWNRRADTPQLDWDKARAHLELYEKEYSDLPDGAGRFSLALTIMPLKTRLDRGERTKWLYDDIMEVE